MHLTPEKDNTPATKDATKVLEVTFGGSKLKGGM
jgi:hypothetical protein